MKNQKFNEKDLIENIFQKWEKEQVKIINIRSEIRFIELLLIYKKYKEAYKVVKKMETLGLVNSELLYLKAKILLEQGQVINVLNILEKIFDDYEDDPFVIDTTIVLLLNNKREVSNKVLEAAIKIASSRLLMLVAVVYNRNMKKEEALDYITRALLKAEDSDVDVFSNYFELHVRSDNDSVRKISCVDSDTTVRMFSEDGIEKVYCIYEKRVLPTEIHHWKNATHIYLDTAINLGLLRKKNGEKVCIDGLDYIITEIMPVEFFLFRICMDRLVEKGIIKQFSIPMMEDGNLDVENFIKIMKDYNLSDDNSPKWLDNYKDLSSIPLPFFQLQKNTRLKFIQFVIALLEDNTIIIRELLGLKEVAKKKYILSITALVMLYKLGINSEYLKENDVIISKATYYEILDEIEEIVKTNNKEEVSSIGVVENQLFLNISSEEEKILMMKEAFGLKKFIEELTIDEGKNDIEDERIEQLNLVDTFGICDYEAMIIARDSKRVLVTGEVTSMYLSQMEEMNISGIGIIDFLTAIKVTGDDLLNYMTQMRKYKFLITITNSSISYLLNCYSELDDIELQECYMEKWINYLSIAEDINEEYKTIFIQILTEVFKYNHKSYMDSFNPMWKNFIFFIMKYNNMKVNVNFTEDGNVEVSTYRLAENQKTWEIIE